VMFINHTLRNVSCNSLPCQVCRVCSRQHRRSGSFHGHTVTSVVTRNMHLRIVSVLACPLQPGFATLHREHNTSLYRLKAGIAVCDGFLKPSSNQMNACCVD
jgi:hypothetical protein